MNAHAYVWTASTTSRGRLFRSRAGPLKRVREFPAADDDGRELTASALHALFRDTYLAEEPLKPSEFEDAGTVPELLAALAGRGVDAEVVEPAEDGTATFAECRVGAAVAWGAAEGAGTAVRAVPAAVNRARRQPGPPSVGG